MESLSSNLCSLHIFCDIVGAIKQFTGEFQVMCVQRAMQPLKA